MIGKILAHYEICSQLGKGGMGEVYRAKDQKLGRDVAIKVLPEEFAKDSDRVARFQREAKLLASLNHPNIAAIHGLEESDGTHFLVLELIEGDTLADRLKRGAISVEESLKLALQIAEALEAAHEKGVIHRDLKPANIKVTPDGKVKVLDFGLAKAFAGERGEMILSDSPTLSITATEKGVIIGTAAYMSPEQARSETVDKKADIWAFGVVLFEMLTGRGMFEGRSVSDVLASVLKSEPEWNSLPPDLHPRIGLLLERCLNKEPKNRYSGISDARVDIQQVLADPSGLFVQPVMAAKPRKKLRVGIPWVAAAIVVASIIVGVAVWYLKPSEPKQVMRLEYQVPEGQQYNEGLSISPDGSKFVYRTNEGLYLRSMDSLDARLISGTDKDSTQPFFSPDGQWIGYFSSSDLKLKKVAISGGAPVALCDTTGLRVIGASWYPEDTIVYSDIASGIMRISSNGGIPESLIKGSVMNLKEGFPVVPQMLPDGKTLLFTNIFDLIAENAQIMVQSLESGERKVLVKNGGTARYLPTGHIVYALTDNNITNLFALPFDLDTLEVTSGSISILEDAGIVAISASGTLVYVPQPTIAAATLSGSILVWVNRKGEEEPLSTPPNIYLTPKISPDGTKIAMTVGATVSDDIWIWEIDRETMTRLTFDEGRDSDPVWTLDGKRIIYASGREDSGMPTSVCWKAADGTGEVEQLGPSMTDRSLYPYSLSQDGKTLMLSEITTSLRTQIGILEMEEDHMRKPLLQAEHNEFYPVISPNGGWMAYQSDESGKYEVYVRSYPEVNREKYQISTSGGDSPLWSRDGRELFYRNGDSFMAVSVETDPTFRPAKPKFLFRGTYYSNPARIGCTFWDISPDGKRFLMMKPISTTVGESTEEKPAMAPQPKIVVVLNWFEELKDRVPVP